MKKQRTNSKTNTAFPAHKKPGEQTMSETLYKGIASALKIDADELIAKLKDDGGEWLPDSEISKRLVSELTTAASAATEAARELAHKKGQSEMSKKFVRLIKNSGFENPDNLSGDALFEAYAEWKSEGAGQTPDASTTPLEQWTREDLEKLPIVKTLKLEAVREGAQKFENLKKDLERTQTEFEKYKGEVVEGQVKSVAKAKVREALKRGNVILSVDGLDIDPEERINAVFERFWSREKVGLNADGQPIILDADGQPKTDPAFGKQIDFDEIVVAVAKPMFGVSTQNPAHSGSGIQQTSNGKPAGYTPTMRFNSQQEYDNYVSSEPDGTKRTEAAKSWRHQQSTAAGK